MHVKNTKFERNSSLKYYHMTVLGKQNIQAKEVYSLASHSDILKISSRVP